MAEVKDIYLYAGSVSHDSILSRLRQAKSHLGWDILLRPNWIEQELRYPVIAFEKPRLLMEYVLIGQESPPEALEDALRWAVLGEPTAPVESIVDALAGIFGFGVRELTPTEVTTYDRDNNLRKVSFRLKLDEPGNSRDR